MISSIVSYQNKVTAHNRMQGFSLLEVLVAFSILSISLGVLMQIFSGGMRSVQVAGNYSQAADLAETVLALAGTEWPVDGGGHSGNTASGLQWVLEVVPYQFSDFVAPPQNIDIYQVVARVAWSDIGGGHEITLSSLRMQPKQP